MPRTIALFDSWRGAYDCNPRAISEQMARTRPDVTRVWVLTDPADAPPGVRAVKPFSPAHLWYLARARYVFANNAMPFFWRKPRRCCYVQTWHGPGAFKKVGWDILDTAHAGHDRYLERFARDVGKWDLLLTTSPPATRHFPRAFRYDGPVLEAGTPRNDLLVEALGTGRRDDVRRSLGLEPGQRAVLYAPTGPDFVRAEADVVRLLESWTAALAEDDVLLLRAHPNDAVLAAHVPASPRVRNVSREEAVQVLLAADVLVTDYSSIFYDFALTGRPIVFLFEDLAAYRDRVRGLYLDVDRDLPGPVAASVEELGKLLDDLPPTIDHSDWLREHLPHDDGHAAQRVVDAVLPPPTR